MVGFVSSGGISGGRGGCASECKCNRRVQVRMIAEDENQSVSRHEEQSVPQREELSVPRREFLGIVRSISAALIGWGVLGDRNVHAEEEMSEEDENRCKNCSGKGTVVCDLCSGTGFWRATSNANPKLRYQGVVCPTCGGKGEQTCLVCLGTGEANTFGMLRKRKIQTTDGRTLQS